MRLGMMLAMLCLSFPVLADKPRIACVGDSLTDSDYPVFLQELCGDRCEVKTFAKKGATMHDISFLFLRALGEDPRYSRDPQFRPTHVVVYGGINDCMLPQGDKRFPFSRGEWTWMSVELLADVAREKGVTFIAIAHHGWAGKSPSGNQCSRGFNMNAFDSTVARVIDTSLLSDSRTYLKKEYDSGDGLHLNRRGYRELARMVFREIFPCW